MAIVPGEIPEPREDEPLLADEPLPPVHEDIAEQVEELDRRIREAGSEEIEKADEAADAVEGDAEDAKDGTADSDPGSAADSDQDPTSDPGQDAEDPEAQQGEDPGSGSDSGSGQVDEAGRVDESETTDDGLEEAEGAS